MILDNMSKECMRLTTSCAILGIGVDGGGIRPADRKEAVVAENDGELAQWEEARRNMTPEEQRTADEAAIRALYEKYMKRAKDGSLSPERQEEWDNAASDLEDKYPDLFNY